MTRHARLVLTLCLTTALLAPPAHAATEAGAAGNAGDGAAAVPGVALPAEAAVGNGAATTNIPIAVPQGRGGMQPNLVLMYSSQGAGFSPYGAGWALPVGTIQRSTR